MSQSPAKIITGVVIVMLDNGDVHTVQLDKPILTKALETIAALQGGQIIISAEKLEGIVFTNEEKQI